MNIDPIQLVRPRRRISGMSAVLLPFDQTGSIDWSGFEQHLELTFATGLTPAVNMDTGYVQLLDISMQNEVLRRTSTIASKRMFVAGAFVADTTDSAFDADLYRDRIDQIQICGGTPILFQSFGLVQLPDDQLVEAHMQLAGDCDRCLFFELGSMFAPQGRIYGIELYERLMMIPQFAGAKHSSLSRELEWQRLELRNRLRPEFQVLTGNDLAIDMVIYGSDYLLGLSTFAPQAFARRDEMWRSGDVRFHELNDTLQYLGQLAFRDPTPAYKHSAAMFLKQQGRIATDRTHPAAPIRPDSDRVLLAAIGDRLSRQLRDTQP